MQLFIYLLLAFCASESIICAGSVQGGHFKIAGRHGRGELKDAVDSAIAGSIACSLMHSLTVPLDVLKTRMQVDSSLGKLNPLAAARSIVDKEGVSAFSSGISATVTGYMLQGGFKFGLYECFKNNIEKTLHHRGMSLQRIEEKKHLIFLGSAATAEMVASLFLCPLEVSRIVMVMNPTLKGAGLSGTLRSIVHKEGLSGLFKGLNLIMLRQVPYTCVKLASYELFKRELAAARLRRCSSVDSGESCPVREVTQPLAVPEQLVTGAAAGVCAAVCSQPADALLSRVCGGSQALSECLVLDSPVDFVRVWKDMGVRGAFSGVATRSMMMASMSAGQFLVYEHVRTALGREAFVSSVRMQKGEEGVVLQDIT